MVRLPQSTPPPAEAALALLPRAPVGHPPPNALAHFAPTPAVLFSAHPTAYLCRRCLYTSTPLLAGSNQKVTVPTLYRRNYCAFDAAESQLAMTELDAAGGRGLTLSGSGETRIQEH